MNRRFKHYWGFILILLFSSCEADIDITNISEQISLQPSLIVPIAGANVTLGQILSHNYSGDKLDYSNGIEINYIDVDSADFSFRQPDFLSNATPASKSLYPSPNGITFWPANTRIPPLVSNDFINIGVNASTSSDRIDSVVINSASLSFNVSVSPELQSIAPSNMHFAIIFPVNRLRLPSGKADTIYFSPIAYGQPVQISLPACVVNTANGQTGIPFQLVVNATNGNTPITLTSTSVITYSISLAQLNYTVAYGVFSPASGVSSVHQRSININKIFSGGLLKFANPKVDITAFSNIGTYFNFQVDYMKSYSNANATLPPAYAWFNGHTTNAVTVNFDAKPKVPGTWVSKKLQTFDKDWGETNQLFENETKPDMIEYKFSATVNQSMVQNDPTPGFVTPDSKMKVYINTTIPFQLSKGSYYNYVDTIPNFFESIASVFDQYASDKISSAAVVLNIKNGLPVSSELSLNFLDASGNVIQTDFEKSYLLKAGKVDASGIVNTGDETKQTIVVSVSKSQLSKLRKAARIAYNIRFSGSDINANMHFTQQNSFDLKVGLYVKGDLSGNINTIGQ